MTAQLDTLALVVGASQRRAALGLVAAFVDGLGSVFWAPVRVVDGRWKHSRMTEADFYVVGLRKADGDVVTLEKVDAVQDAIVRAADCSAYLGLEHEGSFLTDDDTCQTIGRA